MVHVHTVLRAALVAAAGFAAPVLAETGKYRPPVDYLEHYVNEPLPAGFGVQHTDVDGPVFVDASGLTLYKWPLGSLRNGPAGERRNGAPVCENVKQTVNTGLMSPFPGGLLLPDLDTRPTCTQMWPPVLAAAGAAPVGEWGLVQRADGHKQWTYEGFPVYRSALDTRPGQVNGAVRGGHGDAGVRRQAIGPKPQVPPAFQVLTVATGRLVVNQDGFSVYVWDGDAPNTARCRGECLSEWRPVAAAQMARPGADWDVIERVPGQKQWVFRGRPVYTRIKEARPASLEGEDIPGWHNVYTQKNPAVPAGFTLQETRAGRILADANGKSLYIYRCVDDALDNLSCDHPASTQAYRLAVCGKSDPQRCATMFPYALAPLDAKTDSLIWATMFVDPKTGKKAQRGAAGALHVWTFRDRPIYTHGLDRKPGDINADAWGEFNGWRNGYKGFFLRDDFLNNAN
ncbi:MAG: hypothetical protein ABW278_12155 [Steroidobacteraceae bacterium]